MATSVLIPDPATLPSRFELTEQAIAKLAERYMPLRIAGVDDADGFKAVHDARIDIKGKRVAVEKVRKAEKEVALEYGRQVDGIAKRITALLTPIETHLEGEEDRIKAEKDAIKNAAKIKAEAEARAKAEAEAAAMRAEQERLAAERAALEAEKAAIAKAKAEAEAAQQAALEKILADQRRAEDERRAADTKWRLEKEEQIAAQRAAQQKIDDERRANEAEARRLADIETTRKHAEEVKQAQAEAAEKAAHETQLRLEREAQERKEAEQKRREEAAAARQRAEALKPDRERLLAVADAVAGIGVPDVSPSAAATAAKIVDIIGDAVTSIRFTIKSDLGGNANA